MTAEKIPLLLCTNGTPQSLPALDYGLWLAAQLKSPVQLLGILDNKSRETSLNRALSTCRTRLNELHLPYDLVLQRGSSEALIPENAKGKQAVAIFGPLGRSTVVRTLFGRSLRSLLRNVSTPLIYTRSSPAKLEHMLLCVGGMEYSLNMVEIALQLAAKSKPQVTLLHIVARSYSTSSPQGGRSDLLDLLQTDSPQSRNVQAALDLVKKHHLKGRLVVRQGFPVDEILEEAQTGQYDLVGMGSLYGIKGLDRLGTADVSAEVADHLEIPILVARTRVAQSAA